MTPLCTQRPKVSIRKSHLPTTTGLSALLQPDSGRKGARQSHPQAALEKQNTLALSHRRGHSAGSRASSCSALPFSVSTTWSSISSYLASSWKRRSLSAASPRPRPCATGCFARAGQRCPPPAGPAPRPHLDQSQQVGTVLGTRGADAERGHFRRRFPLRPPRLTSPRCVNRRSSCFFIRVPGAAATCGQSGCEHVPAAFGCWWSGFASAASQTRRVPAAGSGRPI